MHVRDFEACIHALVQLFGLSWLLPIVCVIIICDLHSDLFDLPLSSRRTASSQPHNNAARNCTVVVLFVCYHHLCYTLDLFDLPILLHTGWQAHNPQQCSKELHSPGTVAVLSVCYHPFKNRILLLTQDGKLTTPQQRSKELHSPGTVVVLGFGQPLEDMALSLADFSAEGSHITLAVSDDARCVLCVLQRAFVLPYTQTYTHSLIGFIHSSTDTHPHTHQTHAHTTT